MKSRFPARDDGSVFYHLLQDRRLRNYRCLLMKRPMEFVSGIRTPCIKHDNTAFQEQKRPVFLPKTDCLCDKNTSQDELVELVRRDMLATQVLLVYRIKDRY